MTLKQDQRYMAACLRYARRNRSLTGTNPAVGTLLVKNDTVVSVGVTAIGGRPHAERVALDQVDTVEQGTTAYVSLEPCAHHGATPPCAQALINAGVARVVTAWTDPDLRVDGKGHQMLKDAGITVQTGILAEQAEMDLSGYLNRKQKRRPHVTLKLAVSANGKIGRIGEETAITGPLAKAYTHRLRAENDAILVGRSTAEVDDPELTCRLAGLHHRSPHRFVLDKRGDINPLSKMARSAQQTPISLITNKHKLSPELIKAGVQVFAAETQSNGLLALPEILEDMAAIDISLLMVEGGAQTARSFLEHGLVDEIALFTSPKPLDGETISSPITRETIDPSFQSVRTLFLGDDRLDIYKRGFNQQSTEGA